MCESVDSEVYQRKYRNEVYWQFDRVCDGRWRTTYGYGTKEEALAGRSKPCTADHSKWPKSQLP